MEHRTGARSLVPRCCHIVRWPDFNGYGFNLHAEKGKVGQYIGKVDPGSPAEAAGLRQGDRIVEVNSINIGNENHQQVVGRIKSGGDQTRLLVVDAETDLHYKSSMIVVRGDLPEVCFITSSRDDITDSTTAPNTTAPNTNGVGAAAAVSSYHPVRLCKLRKWPDFDGYGFNLHAEKDKPGQFIGVVDAASPAETGGLEEGDRIIEVNGENVEGLSHAAVIGRVKAVDDRVDLVVVDREADSYYKGQGQTVSSAMIGVTVIATPARSKGGVVDINSNDQSSEPEATLASFTTYDEPPSYSWVERKETEVSAPAAEDEAAVPEMEAEVVVVPATEAGVVAHGAEAKVIASAVEAFLEAEVAAHKPEAEVTKAEEDLTVSTLPDPNVSLSDDESEVITAVVAQAVESTPEPSATQEEESVLNGHTEDETEEEQREEAEQRMQEEEGEDKAGAVMSVGDFTQDDVIADDAKREEEEEEEEEQRGVALNDYERVEVLTAAMAEHHAFDDLDAGSYGMNGGTEVPEPEPQPEPKRVEPAPAPARTPPHTPTHTSAPVTIPIKAREPEPEAEPEPKVLAVRSSVVSNSSNSSSSKPAPTGPAMGGDLHLYMSAAQMKERLRAKKKQDPRFEKSTSFEAKSKMFEKL